jgi:hypothetical protein
VDATGRPHKAGDLFVTCVSSRYYDEHIPAILREIAERYHPEGFTDNSWSGLGRGTICYCGNCQRTFRDRSGNEIPRGEVGTIRRIASGFAGTTTAAWKSGT